ncbi:MAG: AAA family ATPase [Candidatus Sphingomonas colombiensis]|nr:bifunctional aminoglycoside phosphotransferase/ATP-binding protein [Sphingomonas sp.]WEK43222.1 MAG: AAA family ATPase [Sphingomonas sp.]
MTSPSSDHDNETDVPGWLQSGKAFANRGLVKRIDTHAAIVFLSGDRAWKMKRPVSLGYLDFSTPARRKAALNTELRLNRRTAPSLYRAVHPITAGADGRLQLDGAGEPIDWLLEMQRFPDDALLAEVANHGGLDEPLLRSLTDSIVAFHGDAAVSADGHGSSNVRDVIKGNMDSMARFPAVLDQASVQAVSKRLLMMADKYATLLDARARAGRVRHCHGDLHLANIALIDGVPTPFDCLEFDTALATTDVLYDLAFLLMDLWERGLRHESNVVFNRYLDLSAQDEAGVGLLPMFMAMRASIRAHVLAAQGAGPTDQLFVRARHYLALASDLAGVSEARLVAIGGLSGTGKSTLARSIGGDVGRAPGARILRSDVLRKRLAGFRPEVRLPASAYTQKMSTKVYRELDRVGGATLAAGISVIADAMFARPVERSTIKSVADAHHARFAGMWLHVSDAVRLQRVVERPLEASDADITVARAQFVQPGSEPLDWTIVDARVSLDQLRSIVMGVLNA